MTSKYHHNYGGEKTKQGLRRGKSQDWLEVPGVKIQSVPKLASIVVVVGRHISAAARGDMLTGRWGVQAGPG